ncbi:hypothetical protein K461DRAFT_310204 [Myriangium duriaei CBS 260.36]|uniref:Uncharacterized protein n=1 Tax=Myriangium duriaei CBS 260.36 TaxID=1168546 RepID=A0A9P4MJP0_9PEZI|nr:hypothetical protein K461DRAFT_310204 [Myriangium duriaei CBS 260.36]
MHAVTRQELASGAITVGATEQSRGRAEFSTSGSAVNIFAAGLAIHSTWIGHDGTIRPRSRTAQAAAYVARLLLYSQAMHDLPTPRQAKYDLLSQAIYGIVRSPEGSPNYLASNGYRR